MDAKNAKSIAAAIEAMFSARGAEARARRGDTLFGSIYLLLAEDAEDGFGALIVLMSRDEKLAGALWSGIQGIPLWDDASCASAVTIFRRVVSPKPLIDSIPQLRERAERFVRVFNGILADPAAQAPYADLLDDPS